nr:Uncharacterised protein [Klebsiella pneumoniae]
MADVEAAMPDWAKAAVAASSNACFYLHSLDEPLLFSSRRFKQTADLGTSDRSLQRRNAKLKIVLTTFIAFLIMSAYSLIIKLYHKASGMGLLSGQDMNRVTFSVVAIMLLAAATTLPFVLNAGFGKAPQGHSLAGGSVSPLPGRPVP